MRRQLAVALGLVALAAGLPASVAAAVPSSSVVVVDSTFVNDFDCPFPLVETVSGAIRDTLYVDGAGNPDMEILTAQYQGRLVVTWTNPASGKSLSSGEASPLIIDWNPDGTFQSLANMGLTFNVTIPGSGTVLLDVGRIVIERGHGITFVAGAHQELFGDTAAFCAALA
jgi:hypothetical protein